MVDWTQVLVALALGLPATITAAGAVWLGFRNSRKIDHNTQLTIAGTATASSNAVVAARAATSASQKADNMASKLNGELDTKIKNYVAPIEALLKTHIEDDNRNMHEIRTALGELRDWAKERR